MRRRSHIALFGVLACAAAAVAWSWDHESNSTANAIETVTRDGRITACVDASGGPVSGGLPPVELPCMSAAGPATVMLSDFADSKPMLIVLWASYCAYCRDELKAIDEYHRTKRDAIHVLTVLTLDTESSAQLILDVAPDLPVAYDRSGRLFTGLRVAQAFPVLVVVRPGGTVAKVYQGPPRTSADQLAELVEQALRPTVPTLTADGSAVSPAGPSADERIIQRSPG